MRKYRKWVLTLGIVVTAPGVIHAGVFDRILGREQSRPVGVPAAINPNQQIANDVAASLKAANLSGTDIRISVQNGTAVISGQLADPAQREMATQVASRVKGVQRVDNQLTAQTGSPAAGGVQHASGEVPAPLPVGALAGRSVANNQEAAQAIATALTKAQLNGFDIRIDVAGGKATLSGAVSTSQERDKAEAIAKQVGGVQSVDNRLQLAGGFDPRQTPSPAEIAAFRQRMQQAELAGFQQMQRAPQGTPVQPANYQPGAPPAAMPPYPGMPPGAGLPPNYGFAAGSGPNTVYNMPYLPEHAWPAYAQYPNTAQVNYPQQYSASAWPYIGPFYPYPQVPLGWRKVQLEWDDGYWQLDFNPRTDNWWWFCDPKNWGDSNR
jgi:osmotically-inducible protein OsmY